MDFKVSRRGFLKGSLSSALLGAGCAPALLTEPSQAPKDAAPGADRVALRTEVNGEAQALEVDPDESALSLLRDRLGLTGTKQSCGHGACGACTVLVGGTPVASCLLPATALE